MGRPNASTKPFALSLAKWNIVFSVLEASLKFATYLRVYNFKIVPMVISLALVTNQFKMLPFITCDHCILPRISLIVSLFSWTRTRRDFSFIVLTCCPSCCFLDIQAPSIRSCVFYWVERFPVHVTWIVFLSWMDVHKLARLVFWIEHDFLKIQGAR